jgi:hypothetical protein
MAIDAGQDWVSGFLWVLNNTNFSVEIKKTITDPVTDTIDKEWERQSPSKVAIRQGQDYIEGLSMGLSSGLHNLSQRVLPNANALANMAIPTVGSTQLAPASGPSITINHPNHPTDDLTRDLQRATVLVGLQQVAETTSINN